eukprot:scaffold4799_cov115-Isochrysis_galbana.AAC.6
MEMEKTADATPKLWPVIRQCQQCARHGQEVPQAVARAWNHTCIELLSVPSTRTRCEPLSAVISTTFSSSRSRRAAIVDLHALAEFFFSTDDTEGREPDARDPTDAKHHTPLHGHTGGVPSDKALSDTNVVALWHVDLLQLQQELSGRHR